MKMKLYLLGMVVAAMASMTLCAGEARAASARPVVLVSDLHVGAGHGRDGRWNNIEDFRWQSDFNAFLDRISAQAKDQADLVLLGDVFELWQSPSMECSTDLSKPSCKITDCKAPSKDLGCAEKDAVERLRLVLAQHGDFIAAIRAFAQKGRNTVVFVPGNHDAALLFPAVRKVLTDALQSSRVTVADGGYWVSPDGAVYADHGHQFDELNKFSQWPKPFTKLGNVAYLQKAWGENMVQEFYNQYESVFPIIDNLSDEKSGVGYAVKQAGFPNSAEAVRRFFRFFLFQQSLNQANGFLSADEKPVWNVAAVRKQPVDFFMDVFPASSRDAMRPAAFDPKELSDAEIGALCEAKKTLEKARQCPSLSGTLSAMAAGATSTPDMRLQGYLRTVLPAVAGSSPVVASAYVYGHTHAGSEKKPVTVDRLPHGPADVLVANTGAFQRTVTPAQIKRILQRPQHVNKRALDLSPEDLPACYSFVWIDPYGGREAIPELRRWASKAGSPFEVSKGTCASFTE